MKTRVAEIDFEMVVQDDPDSHPNTYLFQDPRYREEDQARLDAWRSGHWSFVGVRAKAIIRFPYGANPDSWTTLGAAVARPLECRERQRRRLFPAGL
jgi:hypothetical protein